MILHCEKLVEKINDSYELPNNVLESVKEPLVTVNTITYNHISFIEKCIEGILMQKTSFPFEYIIGEDFSTDGTRKIVFDYAKKYPDIIRVITADYNVSGANPLRCLKAFRGKYIALCEGDDYWTDPLKLQKQVDFMENNTEYVLCYHSTIIKKVDSGVEEIYPLEGRDFSEEELVAAPPEITTATKLFRNVFKEEGNTIPFDYFQDNMIKAYLGTFGKCKYLGSIDASVYNMHKGGTYSSLDIKSQQYFRLSVRNIICNYFISQFLIEKKDDRFVKLRISILEDLIKEIWQDINPGYISLNINKFYIRIVIFGVRFEFYYRPLTKIFKKAYEKFIINN